MTMQSRHKAHVPTAMGSPSPSYVFPSDFVWGTATSSFQIEGATKEDGRGPTVWDDFCQKFGKIEDKSDGSVACDHYHRMEEDVALLKSLNIKAYRFSIAWSRILPNGTTTNGSVNQSGIYFYNHLIDKLLENGIEPWVTLFHWDLPLALEEQWGGWLDRRTTKAFAEYSRICFEAFGDRVKRWITINEGWTVASIGYACGLHAPGRKSPTDPYVAGHNLLLAHAEAVRIYREDFSQQAGMIGISNSGDYRYPVSPSDYEAAERAMEFQIGWFTDPIYLGDYPASMKEQVGDRLPVFTAEERKLIFGSTDFIGLNYYSSQMVSTPQYPWSDKGYWQDMWVETKHHPAWTQNDMDWSVVPEGLRDMLLWLTKRYNRPLIFITENGSAEPELSLEVAKIDEKRRSYFEGHLRACGEALEHNIVNLGGYFAWSCLDNFEWQWGYTKRFGICHVDFETQKRTPKLSAEWYSQTIQAQGSNIPRKERRSWFPHVPVLRKKGSFSQRRSSATWNPAGNGLLRP